MTNLTETNDKPAFVEESNLFIREIKATIQVLENRLNNFTAEQAQDLAQVNKLLDLAYTAYNSCCGLVDEIENIQQGLMFNEEEFINL